MIRTERPIIFTGESVRAILEGRKSMTRRAIPFTDGEKVDKCAPHGDFRHPRESPLGCWYWETRIDHGDSQVHNPGQSLFPRTEFRCPYGTPGDTLWVREALRRDPGTLAYDADDSPVDESRAPDGYRFYRCGPQVVPSIYMPRWACRLTLRVDSVRVERLQEISEEDALAEGVGGRASEDTYDSAREEFGDVWDQINGKRAPWQSNPYVWVVAFRLADVREVAP